MARRFDVDDEDDRDDPLPSDQAIGDQDDDDLDPMPCPHCCAAMSERQEVCPRCGSFVLRDDVPRPRRPLWVTLVLIAALAAMVFGIVAVR